MGFEQRGGFIVASWATYTLEVHGLGRCEFFFRISVEDSACFSRASDAPAIIVRGSGAYFLHTVDCKGVATSPDATIATLDRRLAGTAWGIPDVNLNPNSFAMHCES